MRGRILPYPGCRPFRSSTILCNTLVQNPGAPRPSDWVSPKAEDKARFGLLHVLPSRLPSASILRQGPMPGHIITTLLRQGLGGRTAAVCPAPAPAAATLWVAGVVGASQSHGSASPCLRTGVQTAAIQLLGGQIEAEPVRGSAFSVGFGSLVSPTPIPPNQILRISNSTLRPLAGATRVDDVYFSLKVGPDINR
jgi:hypothetical protein